MRELTRGGIHWTVREIGGSRSADDDWGTRCLIFDSEAVVRRVWIYPANWWELSDDWLWELACGVAHAGPPPAEPDTSVRTSERPELELAAETTQRAQSLLTQISMLRESNRRLRKENQALRDSCHTRRLEMRAVVETFAATMRVEGVAPEQAIVRIKRAIQDGVGAAIAADDLDAETMLHDAVAWGIAGYFAA